MQYKNVDSGDTLTHITLSNEETAVSFSKSFKYFVAKGGNDLLAALNGNVVATEDGVYSANNGIIIVSAQTPVNTLYIKGSGNTDIWAGNNINVCPLIQREAANDNFIELKEVDYVICGQKNNRSAKTGFYSSVTNGTYIEFDMMPLEFDNELSIMGQQDSAVIRMMNATPSIGGTVSWGSGADTSNLTLNTRRVWKNTVGGFNNFTFGCRDDYNNADGFYGRVYSIKLYLNSNLIRNFIPVRVRRQNEEDCGGMYDTINKQVFINEYRPATTGVPFRLPGEED